MKHSIKLIVGLGNPGAAYQHTRHNAGALAVEKLVKAHHSSFRLNRSFKSLLASLKRADGGVVAALPQTYMNLSGEAVAALVRNKGVAPEDLLVVYDDIALPLGQMRLKGSGSAGGHNGVFSVIERLGTKDFARLRLGIAGVPMRAGAPAHAGGRVHDDLSGYVLSKFAKEEELLLKGMLEKACEAMETWMQAGLERAMNRYNKKEEKRGVIQA